MSDGNVVILAGSRIAAICIGIVLALVLACTIFPLSASGKVIIKMSQFQHGFADSLQCKRPRSSVLSTSDKVLCCPESWSLTNPKRFYIRTRASVAETGGGDDERRAGGDCGAQPPDMARAVR